ncbi:MAG: hypothetical protein A3K65_04885 [Euryarchaeota archaeon RBG_16_68_12]|nr:MAG: hypothetical protein A3K65_04885 [Euryarchaeota archaeon RBG_16_68_12]
MIGTWLEELLSSRAKTKVLRLLAKFPAKEYTGREMARTLGLSHRTVDLALQDLAAYDLVALRRIGRANVYTANRDNYRFRAFQELVRREEATLGQLMEEIRKGLPPVLSCVLFGSVARGEERPGSDIDLLVVLKDPKAADAELSTLGLRVSERFSLRPAPILLTPRELRRKWNAPHVVAAREHGLLVAGKPLEEVHAEAA